MVSVDKKIRSSFIHNFLGFGLHKSSCQVDIWYHPEKALVLFTDIGKGTSVTNASEAIVTEIYNQYLKGKYSKENCFFAETYGIEDRGIDQVFPEWDENKCKRVSWRPLIDIASFLALPVKDAEKEFPCISYPVRKTDKLIG